MIKIQAFMALETSLAKRLRESFQAYASPLLAKIEAALEAGDFDEATRLAGTISLHPVFEESKGYVAWATNLAMLFGASRVTSRPGTTVVGLGYEKLMAQQAVANFCTVAADSGTAFLTAQAVQLISQRRAESLVQKDSEASKKAWLSRQRAQAHETPAVDVKQELQELEDLGFEVPTAEAWARLHSKVGPKEFVSAMMGGLPDSGGLELSVHPTQPKLGLHVRNTVVHGAKTKEYVRTLDLDTGDAHHDVWVIDKTAQGSGAAKTGLAKSIELYEKMGMKSISLTANKDAGGYVWARFGFRPSEAYGVKLVMESAQSKLAKLTKLGMPNDASPQAVSEYGAVSTLIGKMLEPGSDITKAVWLLSSMRTPAMDALYARSFKGNSKSLAKHLLRDTYWAGKLDLTDKEAVARTKKYVGAV